MLSLPDVMVHERGYGHGGASKGILDVAKSVYMQLNVNTKFRRFQKLYRDDRLAFVYDCMPRLAVTIAYYQEDILGRFDSGIRRQAVRAPHGSGKTLIAAVLVHHTLLTTEEDATVPTLASVWRQLEKYLWPEIHKVAKLIDWYAVGRDPYGRDELMTHSMRTNGGLSEAFAVASGDAALIEGAHASRLFYVFDESKTIDESMWNAAEGAFATEGTLTLDGPSTSECYWFAISTPGAPSGRFYDIHIQKEGYQDWTVAWITKDMSIEAGRISPQWAKDRCRQWGESSAVYKNRVLAMFATDASEGVIPSAWVEMAFERYEDWVSKGSPGRGLSTRIIGVDAARYGEDKSVFAERVGDVLEGLYVYAKQSTTVTAAYLKPLAQSSTETRIEMDSGLGAAVYDTLDAQQSWDHRTMNLVPIHMGAGYGSMDSTNTFFFQNMRAASWWHMRELLDPDGPYARSVMMTPDNELLGDLSAPMYEIKTIHDRLTICIEPKENIKKANRLGRSPDKGDACVLAYWNGMGGSGAEGVLV